MAMMTASASASPVIGEAFETSFQSARKSGLILNMA
jgi:hypothetical protein